MFREPSIRTHQDTSHQDKGHKAIRLPDHSGRCLLRRPGSGLRPIAPCSSGRCLLRVPALALLLALALLVPAAALAGCEKAGTGGPSGGSQTGGTVDTISQATRSRFRSGEIQEFQGKFLDPAIGPRDNSIKGIQQVDIARYRLMVDGLVSQPQTLAYEEAKALPNAERLITLHCVEGWQATILWQGVLIEDLIARAGVRPEADTVIFHAVDGYTTSLPLSLIRERKLILAHMANGLPLPPHMGYPFIVVAEDKLGYKWARWVSRIELSSDRNYRGYWEQFGYSNDASLDG